MSTLNHDLEQSWNYSKFSCPSGPSMRAADISVVAVEDERYFEADGESIFHYLGVSSNESHREGESFVSHQTPLNMVSQRENILFHIPYGEERFVGASVDSRPQGQHSVRYNANEYMPRVQRVSLHTRLTPYSSEDPSAMDQYDIEFETEHNSRVFPTAEGQITGDYSSPIRNSSASSQTGGPVYPQPVNPPPVYSQPFYPEPVYPEPISPFVRRSHHIITPTRSPSTANHSFGDQQYDISFGAHEVKVDVGNGGGGYVTKPLIYEPPRCQYCGRSVRALNRHIRDVHQNRTIDCPEDGCKRKGNNGFGRSDNLRDHLRRVHDIPIPKISRRKKKEAE